MSGIKNSERRKQLNAQQQRLEVKLKSVNESIFQSQLEAKSIKGKIKSIISELESLQQKEIVITDHALVRYLERAMDIDMLGNGKYPIKPGIRAVVKDRAVISITPTKRTA